MHPNGLCIGLSFLPNRKILEVAFQVLSLLRTGCYVKQTTGYGFK